MTHITHHQHHATVVLDGDIEWTLIHDVVRAIEDAVEYYHYTLIELRVRSLGGSNDALRYLLERLDAWRERGVRFRTHALARTSSGAALLVALGDERLASLGATLRFHGASMYRDGDVSAPVAAALHDKLSRANDRLIERLVDRVLVGAHVHGQHGAKEADREVLEGLCLGAPPDPAGTAPARLQMLAGALGQTVDTAIGDGDRKSLAHLYGRLLQIDRPVSPELAATLGLLDRAMTSDSSASLVHDTVPSCPTSSIPFASPEGAIARETLTRHVLVLGDDCTAASRHCLVPLVAALARAPEGEVGAVLVFDPVQELTGVLHNLASDRLQVLESDRIRLDLVAGNPSLAQTLETGQWMTAATAILVRTLDLVPGSPARVLVDVSGRVVDPVAREGTMLALSAIALVLMLTSRHSARPEGWLPDSDNARWLFSSLMDRVRCVDGERAPNVLATALWLLSTVSGYSSSRLANEASQTFGRCPGEELDLAAALGNGAEALSAAGGHAQAVLEVANAVLAPFATPETRTCLYFGCEPGFDPDEALDFVRLVSGVHHARFVLFNPKDDGADALVARAVKQVFLEAVVARGVAGGPSPDLPLCGFIARDFEHQVTAVDAAFLDRARSAGGFAILASRSVSAIEHALRDMPGGEAGFGAFWSGTGTKVVFRSTDHRTQELVRGLTPSRPGLPNRLHVRPLPGLATDECYLSGADGRFERRRLVPWTEERSAPVGPGGPSKVVYLGDQLADTPGGDAA